jgi:GT2 family glycosyltransferase
VIVLDWYGADDTEECLHSLLQYEPSVKVTVIDNSDDHSACQVLATKFDSVNFIFNEVNRGFAGGCNQGFLLSAQSGARFTMFLNNDTVITQSFIDEVTEWMSNNEGVGAVSPMINYYSTPDVAWFHGSVVNPINMEIIHENESQKLCPTSVPWLTGCAMIVSNDVFSVVSGFDETFFMYSEDVDVSLRMTSMGFDLFVYPIMSVLHKVSKSTSKVSEKSLFYSIRNKILVLRKHYPSKLFVGSKHLLWSSFRDVIRSDKSILRKFALLFVCFSALVMGAVTSKVKS